MRTKTLIIASALVAAGIVTSAAQVFSVNVVGYVNVTVPAGFSIIANPLDNTNSNALSELIPNPPFGTTVYKFDPVDGFASTTFQFSWDPDFTLNPGEAAFINTDEETTLTFVGEVKQGDTLDVNLAAGFNLVSSIVPAEESLEDAGFPAEFGDTFYLFRSGDYVSTTFLFGWDTPVTPRVGEGFWVNRTTATTWSREFNVNP
jgi:hypothetical protein